MEGNIIFIHTYMYAFQYLTVLSLLYYFYIKIHFGFRHEDVSLDERSQHIIRYRPVKDLVPTGAVELVWKVRDYLLYALSYT